MMMIIELFGTKAGEYQSKRKRQMNCFRANIILKVVKVSSFEYLRIHGTSKLKAFRDGYCVLKTILKE